MSHVRAQVRLPSASGIPADAAINTWHFTSNSLTAAQNATSAQSQLTTFYQAIDGPLLSGATILGPLTTKFYDMTDVEPRVPILEGSIVFSGGVGAGFPTEVAVCLSYQAARVSGQPQARRRGRVYLGPLDADVFASVSGKVVVSPTAVAAVAAAATALAGANPVSDSQWAVFSPTTAGAPPWSEGILDDAMHVVTDGWVDNAFDTQRRRGTDPTIRTVWT